MKKYLITFCSIFLLLIINTATLNIAEPEPIYAAQLLDIEPYQEQVIELCYVGYSSKSYMSYRAITSKTSEQYQFIYNQMHVDLSTGYLKWNTDSRYIGVALGSYFGDIGSLWKFVFEDGQELYAIKIEMKADQHVVDGCRHKKDYSIIEFVVDIAAAEFNYGTPLSYGKLWEGDIVEIYRMEIQ